LIYTVETISILKNQYSGQFIPDMYSTAVRRSLITNGDLDSAIDQFELYKVLPVEHNDLFIPLYGWSRICRLCQFPMTLNEYYAANSITFQDYTILKHETFSPRCPQNNVLNLKLKSELYLNPSLPLNDMITIIIEKSKFISQRINNLKSYNEFNPIPTNLKKGSEIQIFGEYPGINKKFPKIFGY